MSEARLEIRKTYKLYVGGQFVRSESGRVLPAQGPDKAQLDQYSHASRKDLRDAVSAARGAQSGWASRTAYLRGQILYRAAEMLEGRSTEVVREITRSTGASGAQARTEVAATVDRLVYFAGWADKYAQVFGSVNPVASPHFNFTTPEPAGVVAVIAPDEPSLLAAVSLLAPVILSGNAAVLLASEKYPLPVLTWAEILATSDVPPGVVNILAGRRTEVAPHLASHMDINGIVDGAGLADLATTLASGAGHNLKRYAAAALSAREWFTEKAEDPYWILNTIEFKTAWHPIGV